MVWLVLFLATDHQPGQGSGTAQSQHGQQNQRERIGGLRDNSSRCRGCCRCLGGSGRCRGRSSAGRIAAVGGSITRGRSSRRRGGRGGRLRGLRLFARLGLLLELPADAEGRQGRNRHDQLAVFQRGGKQFNLAAVLHMADDEIILCGRLGGNTVRQSEAYLKAVLREILSGGIDPVYTICADLQPDFIDNNIVGG